MNQEKMVANGKKSKQRGKKGGKSVKSSEKSSQDENREEKKPAIGKDTNDPGLIITRMFDAPRDIVWKFWTEVERFKCWWGPKDFTAPYSQMDVKVGGKLLYCMRSPEGKEFWGTGNYIQIIPNEILSYTDYFADEKGKIVPPSYYGMQGEWGKDIRVTVSFEDFAGKTKFTLRHEGIPLGNDRDGANEGWNQSFDKLAECLKLYQTEECECENQ